MRFFCNLLLSAAILFPSSAQCWLVDDVAIHGFISQGYLKSIDNDFLADTRQGTFSYDEVGINFSTDLTDNLWVGTQLFARRLGKLGNNKVFVDWAIGDYHWKEWLSVRVGKIRLPLGLYNEVIDIDIARTNILLPSSVYPESIRKYRSAYLGFGLYGTIPLNCLGEISYNAFLGTLDVSANDDISQEGFQGALDAFTGLGFPAISYSNERVNPRYIYGFQAFYVPSHPCIEGLRTGVSLNRVYIQSSLTYSFITESPALVPLLGIFTLPATIGTADTSFDLVIENLIFSFEWAANDWNFAMEYALQPFKSWVSFATPAFPGALPFALPASVTEIHSSKISEAYYAMLSYHLNDCFTFGGYYSVFHGDRTKRNASSNTTKDLALTVRTDVNEYFVLKFEGHRMQGTGLLNGLSNIGSQTAALLGASATTAILEKNWWLFAVKATFSF